MKCNREPCAVRKIACIQLAEWTGERKERQASVKRTEIRPFLHQKAEKEAETLAEYELY